MMDKIRRISIMCMPIVLRVIVFSLFLYLIIGEIYGKKEYVQEQEQVIYLNDGWELLQPDGSREELSLPARLSGINAPAIIVERQLPDYIAENMCLAYQVARQDAKIYIDNQLVESFSTKESRIAGTVGPNIFVFIPVGHQDENKTVRLELTEMVSTNQIVSEVMLGSRLGIYKNIISRYGRGVIVGEILLILGIVTLLLGFAMELAFRKKTILGYIGWGMILLALWLLCESRIRQFYIPNISVSSDVAYMAAMLLPLPFLLYINAIQEHRYETAYLVVEMVDIVNFVYCTLRHMLGIQDFCTILTRSERLIGLSMMFIFVTFVIDVFSHKIRKYRFIAVGFMLVFAAAVDEMIRVQKGTTGKGLIVFATIFLMLMTIQKTVQDMFQIEKERQRATVEAEAKTNFLAGISHEIRTPINSIIGMNEMLLRENKDEGLTHYIINLRQASQMLLALVNDILDFSKIQSGKMEIIENPYYISSVIHDVCQVIAPRAKQKNLKFSMVADTNLPAQLLGDEIRIKQIMLNLLTNAVKYTREGSIHFSIKKGEYSKDKIELKIAVTDTGIGIKEEDIEKLFISFKRLDGIKNASIEGTGLGLSITKNLVEQMRGTIFVESVYGKGSLFTVVIPQEIVDETPMGACYSLDENTQELSDMQETFYAPDVKLLVVDDNEMNLVVVSELLKRTKIQIDTALGGIVALQKCETQQYDLIFMDHMMPEMDGIETLHHLKTDPQYQLNNEIPVIVLTANAIAGVKELYLQKGFDDYLSKPIDVEELESMLIQYLPPEKIQKC